MSTNTKRSAAITIFNTTLVNKETLGDTKFRATVIGNIMDTTKTSHASAASLYNHAKKAAQKAGTVEAFGRINIVANTEKKAAAKAPKKVYVEEVVEEVEEEEVFALLDWAVVDANKNIIDTFNSKSTAYRARNKEAGEMVKKTDTLATA